MAPSKPTSNRKHIAAKATRRKHVTKACNSCRDGKVKCDGNMPACSKCRAKGQECRYETGEDRRKLPLRVAVDLLHSRVNQLSQFLAEQGLEPPHMNPEDEEALSGMLRALGLSHNQPLGDGGDIRDDVPPQDEVWRSDPLTPITSLGARQVDRITSAETRGRDNYAIPSASAPMYHVPSRETIGRSRSGTTGLDDAMLGAEEPIGSNESDDELVEQLSDRTGTLRVRPGGHIRLFGSTSNFHLLETQGADGINIHRTVRSDGSDHLRRLGIGKEVPPEIEKHLINLYFAWQDPALHVVDRAMYEEAGLRWNDGQEDTAYYSEALKNAMCSLGAAFDTRHHPDFVTFPRSLPDFFADRAKALVDIELDSPSVATIQTLVLLSAHDFGCGRDARGWIFSGMATRLAFVLALHQDLTQYVTKGVVTEQEAELRRMVFWGVCIIDHTWSFSVGQPLRLSFADATVAKPVPYRRETKYWTPYVSPTLPQKPVIDHMDQVCRCQVLLIEAVASLGTTLYGTTSLSKKALQELNERAVIELLNWKADLPSEVQVDESDTVTPYLPHVIILHMQYYQSIIYAHRPWMSKSYLQPNPPQGPGPGHARKMCMDAARAIPRLLLLYERRYTLRQMNIQGVSITFSAALLLIFAAVSRYPGFEEDEVLAHLGTCFRALDELGSAWESAKRARDFLVKLQRHWEIRARSNNSSHRDAFARRLQSEEQGSSPNTRRRTLSSPRDQQRYDGEPVASGAAQDMGLSDDASAAFGMDLDLDWMLTTDLESMPGDWGSFFSVGWPGFPAVDNNTD